MATVRPRRVSVHTHTFDADITRGRHTAVDPTAYWRVRLINIEFLWVDPSTTSGRGNAVELYFGMAGSLITDTTRGIDILVRGLNGTRMASDYWQVGIGPRGYRGEPLSYRWRGRRPSGVIRVFVRYTLEA